MLHFPGGAKCSLDHKNRRFQPFDFDLVVQLIIDLFFYARRLNSSAGGIAKTTSGTLSIR